MSQQRATCPYCGKFSIHMYYTDSTRKREQTRCVHCGRVYSVVYGDGEIKTERSR